MADKRKINTAAGEAQYFFDVFGHHTGKENALCKTALIWDGDVIALEKSAEQTHHYLFEPNSTHTAKITVQNQKGTTTSSSIYQSGNMIKEEKHYDLLKIR